MYDEYEDNVLNVNRKIERAKWVFNEFKFEGVS